MLCVHEPETREKDDEITVYSFDSGSSTSLAADQISSSNNSKMSFGILFTPVRHLFINTNVLFIPY